MIWGATVIGAAAGWALASIPGALLGGVLGHVLDRRLAIESWAELRQRLSGRSELPLEELQFVLLGRLAKSEGRVLEVHIRQARDEMRRLGLDETATHRAMAAFSRGKRAADELPALLKRLRERPEAGQRLLASCWRMSAANGRIGPQQAELILLWGRWLGFSTVQIEGFRPRQESPRQQPVSQHGAYEEALTLLGVAVDSDPAEIKRAYRRQLSRHHPDKLSGTGASEAEVRQATEQTRRLQAAYELVRRRRGFR